MQSVSPQAQEEYVLSFQRGEQAGFDWVFRQLYPTLTLYANSITRNRIVAEELASDAFVKIWARHHQFHNWAHIRAFLHYVVRNEALQYLRKVKREERLVSDLSYLRRDDLEADCFSYLVSAETSRLLQQGIDGLPPACGAVFKTLYNEGKSLKEAAQILYLSPNTIKAQRRKGLALLRERLATLFTQL